MNEPTRTDVTRPASGGRPAPVLGRTELDRVIRRAAELQYRESDAPGADDPDGLPEAEIVRIGEEVGLERRHLMRALGEVRAEQLAPVSLPEEGISPRFFGPARVQAARTIPGAVEQVAPRLHAWLRQRESLTPLRERVGSSIWEPNQGFVAQLQRGMNWGGHHFELAQAKSIEVSLVSLEEGWVLITLAADISNARSQHGWGWVGGLGMSGAGLATGVGLAMAFPPVGVAALAAGSAVAGAAAGRAAGVRALNPVRRRMTLALEGLLDRVERDDLSLPSSRGIRTLRF